MFGHRRSASAQGLPQEAESLRKATVLFLWVAGLSLGVLVLQTGSQLAFRQTETVTVTKVYAPRTCRDSSSMFAGKRGRSGPSNYPGSYCGIVSTDHGSFVLPESNRLHLFGPTREDLFDALTAGCRVTITVAGLGLALRYGQKPSNARNRTLVRAMPTGDCGTDTAI